MPRHCLINLQIEENVSCPPCLPLNHLHVTSAQKVKISWIASTYKVDREVVLERGINLQNLEDIPSMCPMVFSALPSWSWMEVISQEIVSGGAAGPYSAPTMWSENALAVALVSNTVYRPLVVDVLCVLFWDHARWLGPKQNTHNIYHKRVINGVHPACLGIQPCILTEDVTLETESVCINLSSPYFLYILSYHPVRAFHTGT